MKQRSKSDSNCLPQNHDPPYSSMPILGHFIHENQERGGSSPNLLQQQYQHTAYQATSENKHAPQPGSVYFSQGQMKDVSLAMKQYIDDAESKQNMQHFQNENLSAKLANTQAQLRKSEGELNQERSQHARDRQQLQIQYNQQLKALEMSVLDKDEQLRNTKKACEKLKSQIDALHAQKQEIKNFIQTQDESRKEEKIRLEELSRVQNNKIDSLSIQLDSMKETENRYKDTEARTRTELQLKAQELHQKDQTISDLKDKVKSLKDELKSNQIDVASKNKEHDHAVEVSRVMQFEISKLKDKLAQQENEARKLANERDSFERQLFNYAENEEALKRAASNGQEMLVNMQEKLDELKEQNSHLLTVIKDSENRERELERKLSELSQANVNASYNESFIESKIMKTESKLKKDVAKIKRNSNEVFQKHKIENEALKDEVRNLQKENQQIVYEWKEKEHHLLNFYNEKIKGLTTSYESERQNVQLLEAQLEKSYAIIADFEDKTHNLSRKSSESDNQRIGLEVINTELRVQLEHQTKNFESVQTEQREKEKEQKFVIAQLRKKNKELQQINVSLSSEISRSNDDKDRCLNDLEILKDRKSQIEKQSKQLSTNLYEMNQFMQKTREEVEQLRTENERQVEANQKLSANIELLKARYTNEHERHVEHKSDNEFFQNELRQKREENEYLCDENSTLKRKLQEGVLTLERLISDNEQYQYKLTQQDEALSTLKRKHHTKLIELESLGKHYNDVTAKLNEVQGDLSSTKQEILVSQKEESDLRKGIRTLKYQIEDLERQKSTLNAQYEGCSRDKQLLQEKVESLSESLHEMQSNFEDLAREKKNLTEYACKIECETKRKFQTLQHQEEKIAELIEIKENLQTNAAEAKEQIVSLETRNKRLEKEIEDGRKEHEVEEARVRGLEKQVRDGSDALEKLKVSNSSLKIKIEELKTQQNSCASHAATRETTYRDLREQFENMKVEKEHLQNELSASKAKTIEMQGTLDSAQKKQEWFTQHDEEQRTEVAKLRESNGELKKQINLMTEKEMRTNFQIEKLESEVERLTADLASVNAQMGTLKESKESLQEDYKTQFHIYERNLKEITTREKEAVKAFEGLQEEHKELSRRYDEVIKKSDELTLKNHQLSDALTNLEAENKQKHQQETTMCEKNERLQDDYVKLVDLLRKLKKERDSLSAMFDQSEEENKQLISRYKKLHAEMLNTNTNLQKQKQQQSKAVEDNEQLKSRINILKYAESLRLSENKELLQRLEQLESQLNTKEANNSKQHDDIDDQCYTRQTSCNLFTDSINKDTIIKLCERLHTTIPATSTPTKEFQSIAEKYKDDLKGFMKQLLTKNSDEETHYQRKRFPTSRRSLRHRRYRRSLMYDDEEDEWNNRQMDRLYEDTKRIQASLLADIKNLSKNFTDPGKLLYA